MQIDAHAARAAAGSVARLLNGTSGKLPSWARLQVVAFDTIVASPQLQPRAALTISGVTYPAEAVPRSFFTNVYPMRAHTPPLYAPGVVEVGHEHPYQCA